MKNITAEVDEIGFPPAKDLKPEEKVLLRWDSDPIFLAKEESRELYKLNIKTSKILNYFKATIVVLILILVVLIIIAINTIN